MDDLHIDRSELEEMVASSPFGEIFFAPTVTGEGCSWSFLVHEKSGIINSIRSEADSCGRVDDCAEALFVLIHASTDDGRVPVLALLFKFETDPPVVYSVFMNPVESNVRELLDDLALQDELVIEFFEEQRVRSVTLENGLKGSITAAIDSLEGFSPVPEDAFDLVVDELLSKHPDPMSMWNRLRSARGEGEA